MSEKLYSINEACRIFNIPRSVLMNGVINQGLETTLKFDTFGCRCRHKHYVTERAAKEFHQKYLSAAAAWAEENEEAELARETKRNSSKPFDTFNLGARRRIEELRMLKDLAGYGIGAEDLM